MTNIPDNSSQTEIDALSAAVRAVTTGLSLEGVLRQLSELAAKLVGVRYAALGVPDDEGGLQSFFTYGMTDKQVSHMDHYPLGLGLLGRLLKSTEPIRLENMRDHDDAAGFCANHPIMTTFLGVPIVSKGKHLGSLYLCDRVDGQPFTANDEKLVSLLADHAAIAIENAKLSDQTRKLAIVAERDRIAMELHDGIIQAIYAVGLKLEIARTTYAVGPEIDAQIRSATQDLNRVIEDLRRYIQDLNVGVNFSVELQDQLKEIADGFRSISTARLVMDVGQAFSRLTEERVHAITQIVREALSNIVRHSDATEVYLDLHEAESQISLTISDNGKGFDEKTVTLGKGLTNMRRRVKQLGGTLAFNSQEGRGTTLTMTLRL